MDKINHCINHNRFIPIDTEELTALELIGKSVEKTNELVDKTNDHEERLNKKVTYEDMKEKYKFNNEEDIDYRGKWFGLDEPTLSDEGMRAQVQKNRDDIIKHSEQFTKISNDIKEVLVTDFKTWQECHDFCKANKKVMRIPKGTYTISTPLQVSGVDIIGDGALNTLIKIECDNAFVLSQYEQQKQCTLSGFSIVDYNPNYERCGIKFAEGLNGKRSRGYKIDNVYFENLGCAIELMDCFRVGLTRLSINNCFRALYIRGQVVQLSGDDITSNCDIPKTATSLRYVSACGIELVGSSHTGIYERPESIKFTKTSMVSHDRNLRVNDVLYASFIQCDLDLSRRECILISAYDGMLIIGDSWISTKSETDEPIVRIMNADNTFKKLVLRNNNISVLMNGHADKGGVVLGYNTDTPGKKGASIIGNTIKTYPNVTQLKYGILAKNPIDCNISDNFVEPCTTKEIYCSDISGGVFNDNVCSRMYLGSSDTTKRYTATGNVTSYEFFGSGVRNRDYYTGVTQ